MKEKPQKFLINFTLTDHQGKLRTKDRESEGKDIKDAVEKLKNQWRQFGKIEINTWTRL